VSQARWHFDPQDNAQDKRVLRSGGGAKARLVRERFPAGTRVTPRTPTGQQGTVTRHVPGINAQGGYLVVLWDNGVTGRHGPISLERVEGEQA
jgi:hypothetical protein